MNQSQLVPLIQREVQVLLGGYIQASVLLQQIDTYIVPPRLGKQAGMLGALVLAEQAASDPA